MDAAEIPVRGLSLGAGRASPRQAALAVFLVALALYLFPITYDLLHKPFFTWTAAQDIASTSLLPIAFLERGEFTLDQFRDFYAAFSNQYFVAEVNGHLVSRSPIAAAVLAIPFYGVPLASGWIAHPPNAWLAYPWTGYFVAKFSAAIITALAALMIYFCARELTDSATSAMVALAFALGTSAWSTASQALWQQTPSLLFQSIGIWFLLRGRRRGASAVAPAAFFFSAATVSRINDGIAAIVFTLFILIKYRSAFWRWVLWSIPPALFFLLYNAGYNGSPLVAGYQDGIVQYLALPRLDGLVGLLASPSRGLLVYSPFFVFVPYGLWKALHQQDRLFYGLAAAAAALGILLVSTFGVWDGGWGYGTRFLVDVLPYLVLLLVPALAELKGASLAVFGLLVCFAAVLQAFGLWDYGVRWQWHWPGQAYNVWDLGENEPFFYLKQYVSMAQHYLTR